MNARQMKKHLKKQLAALKSDNNLMRRIIVNSPSMQELYDKYSKSLNLTYSTLQFQEYRTKNILPYRYCSDEWFITLYKDKLANDLFEGLKDNIIYDIDTECETPTITASIFVGRKLG